uniref:Retrotransposon gag domain-containing protein n=1 Tax=Lactuca sativa TaxID=4236 RepID=A0A9R1WFQ3_LACSA|nr:hypothetical protein LSAT_V11C200066500 [Lactuca sativa]
MTSLWMDKIFTCTYFPVTLLGNASKSFKALRPGSISIFKKLRYLFLHNFMQLRKVQGDVNSIIACKQKKGESIRAYYDRFNPATLSIPDHKEYLVTGAFDQGLLPGPLSRKTHRTMPKSRDALKYRVEKYLRFCPFVKDEPRSYKMEVQAVEKPSEDRKREKPILGIPQEQKP